MALLLNQPRLKLVPLLAGCLALNQVDNLSVLPFHYQQDSITNLTFGCWDAKKYVHTEVVKHG